MKPSTQSDHTIPEDKSLGNDHWYQAWFNAPGIVFGVHPRRLRIGKMYLNPAMARVDCSWWRMMRPWLDTNEGEGVRERSSRSESWLLKLDPNWTHSWFRCSNVAIEFCFELVEVLGTVSGSTGWPIRCGISQTPICGGTYKRQIRGDKRLVSRPSTPT